MQGAGQSAGDSSGNRPAKEYHPPHTEEWIRLVLESAREYGIFTLDLNGTITSWNVGAQRILGYSEAEIIGQDTSLLFTPEDRAARQPEIELEQALKEGRAEDERWHLRKDGSRFWASGLAMPLKGDAPTPHGVLKILRDLTDRKASEDAQKQHEALLREARDTLEARVRERTQALEEANRKLEHQIQLRKRLERVALEAAEREQRRIGQELHDTVCQELAGLSLSAKTLARRLKDGCPTHSQEADRLGELLRGSADSVRRVARGLYPVELRRGGLMTALQELAATVNAYVRCNFHCPEAVLLPDAAVSLHLYRIAQEAVTNAMNYAKAGAIRISLVRDGALILEIADDGRGFESGQVGDDSMGLELMHYRAAVAGGTLSVSSEPNKGTVVRCSVPLAEQDPESPDES